MLNRRKRIPYDPPGARKKKRRRPAPMRADQLFLTRRMFVIKGAIVAAFTTLVGKLAHMQIVKGEVFAQQAEENTQTFQPMKAPRGLIYDRAGRPLAENRRSWEVRIVPAELPDEKVQPIDFQRVRETLINWLRLPEALVVNPAGVPIGSERTVYGRIANLLGDDDVDWWVDYITQQAKINYLVMCDDELTADRAATFRAAAQELPGVEVVSIFDYRVTNIGDPRQPVVIKKDVSREVALKLLSNSIYLPGVQLDDTQLTRAYPSGDVMSHLLGYASIIQKEDLEDAENKTEVGTPLYLPDDVIGQAGIERSLEDVLRGQKGGRWVEVDTHGVQQRILDENPVVPGKNLKLTIDLELQAAASEALQVGFTFSNEDRRANDVQENAPPKEYTAGAGAVVALDPRTGEVLAMVSFPTYDNRLFLEGISARKYKAYQEDRYHPLINKCVAEHYAPGSTFKLFHAAAALRERVIDETTTFTCTGAIRVPWTWDESKGNAYPCWFRNPPGHQALDIYEAIAQSCDVYFYNVGTPRQQLEGLNDYLHYYDYNVETQALGDRHDFVGLGIDKIKMNMTKRFWFGRETGIDLPWEAPGLVPDPEWKWDTQGEGWSSGDTIITSIGQGDFRCTPLQLAVNTASFANGGKILRPLLVKEIVDDQKESIQSFDPELLRDTRFSGTFLNIVREGMRRVVHGEHSSAASENRDGSSKWEFTNPKDEEEIIIAGKTGTAEFGEVNEETLEYEQQHAWFTCYAPFDDPEIVVTVIVEDGGEGSNYAVPIVDKVLRAYFELSGRRQRGTILREDKRPVGDDAPAPEGLLFMAEPGTRTPLIPAD